MTFLAIVAGLLAAPAGDPVPHWITFAGPAPAQGAVRLERSIDVGQDIAYARLFCVADFCDAEVRLGAHPVAYAEAYADATTRQLSGRLLPPGRHRLSILVTRFSGPSAVACRLELVSRTGERRQIVSDDSWRVRGQKVVSRGPLVEEVWSGAVKGARVDAFDDYEQWRQALGTRGGTSPSSFQVLPGFEIELLRSAGEKDGSWVSLELDPKGRILIGVESRGILRVTLPGEDGGETVVERVDNELAEPRGLLWAYDSLYVNANNTKALFRLRDEDGDGKFEKRERLYATPGGVGHGRNDLALGPDGKIYSIHGDAVRVPRDLLDRTSPFREHGRGKKTVEGCVLRFDPDGKSGEIVAAGLRNPYGIDFNIDGEMFTYDADAEFDMGSPWYRPTRVRHLVSGADYGWRGVTGRWPPYFPETPESPPSNLDVGKGSPTSVKFGTKSAFPGRYRRALFILDWAYGRILAVHTVPRGASYLCRSETFLKGRPLNVTDLGFGPDGAMYFVTGGRRTRSALYRVRHVGSTGESRAETAQELARAAATQEARALRRRLELCHARSDAAGLELCWQHIASADPWIRHAARVGVEHRPVERWRERALSEVGPRASLVAWLALSRVADDRTAREILGRLVTRSEAGRASFEEKRMTLRVASNCLDRLDKVDEVTAGRLGAYLDRVYPQGDFELDRANSLVLARLDFPTLVAKTIRLLDRAQSQDETYHYLFVLRNATKGWTESSRGAWVEHFARTRSFLGGRGMKESLDTIRKEFLATLEPSRRQKMEALLETSKTKEPASREAPPRPLVKRWKIDELAGSLGFERGSRDTSRGRRLFEEVKCARCHRVGRIGVAFGPDLTAVSSRFTRRDLLASILTPSAVVAEQHRSVTVVLKDGSTKTGRVVQRGDYRKSILRLQTDPFDPTSTVGISKPDIVSRQVAEVSPMPGGLLDALARDEILDLIAFLEQGGE